MFKNEIRRAINRKRKEYADEYQINSDYFIRNDPLYLSAFLVTTTTLQTEANKYLEELGFSKSPIYVNCKYGSGLIMWTIGSFDLCQKVGLEPLPEESWKVGEDRYAKRRAEFKARWEKEGVEVQNVG